MGVSQQEIKKRLIKLLNLSRQEIRRIMYQSAQSGYNLDVRRFPQTEAVQFSQNTVLQQIVSAATELAEDDFTNLTQTIGMVDPFGNALPLQDAYRTCTDFAFKQVVTGAVSYTEAIRQATENLAGQGVRVIDYESGVHTSLEAAVRRNIMGDLELMQEQIMQTIYQQFGCDGWEITAHAASAPDHEPIQGRQYSDADYTALNNSLRRRIGTLNCGHAAFPIILGVNAPQYTAAELEKFRHDNEKGVTIDGKHYTVYQAAQMQWKLEQSIRWQKNQIMVDEATGNTEKLRTGRAKLTVLRQRYKELSKDAGLRTQYERTEVAGFGGKCGLVNSTQSGIIEQNSLGKIPKVSKTSVPALPAKMPDKTEPFLSGDDGIKEYLNATAPGQGSVTYYDGYNMERHKTEVSFAKWLHGAFGGDIKLLEKVNQDKVHTPDYIWNRKLWDLKTSTTEKSANGAVRHGLKQIFDNPGGIIFRLQR